MVVVDDEETWAALRVVLGERVLYYVSRCGAMRSAG